MKARHEFFSDEAYNEYLRIYLSAIAMSGLLVNSEKYYSKIPESAVEMADALMKELKQTP
jgi:hypothetical protein